MKTKPITDIAEQVAEMSNSPTLSPYFPSPTVLNKRRGRQLGSANKTSQSIRWGFVEAYRQLGGVDGLVKWGREKPDLFYPMLKALLPTEMAEAGLGGNLTIVVQRTPSEKPLPQSAIDVTPSVSVRKHREGTD